MRPLHIITAETSPTRQVIAGGLVYKLLNTIFSNTCKVNQGQCAVACTCKNDQWGSVTNYNGLFQSAVGCTREKDPWGSVAWQYGGIRLQWHLVTMGCSAGCLCHNGTRKMVYL